MSVSLLFASVIPDRKTPRGVDFFTYAIPEDLVNSVTVGTTVVIPFRNRHITGVVLSTDTAPTTQKQLKPIDSVALQQPWLRPDRMNFLQWFALYYCVSLPTALHVLQRPLIKSMNLDLPKIPDTTIQQPEIILYNTPRSYADSLLHVVRNSTGPCIVIAPEIQHLLHIEHIFREAGIEYLTIFGSTSKKLWSAAQSIALGANDSPRVIIGSRTALFLAFGPDTTIYIAHEHEKSHKQYEMNPRYRAGVIAQFLTHQPRSGVRSLFFASPSPTLYSWMQFREGHATLRDVRQKTESTPLVIDMNHYANEVRWLSDRALQQMRGSQKTFIFLNRIGLTAYSICSDCGKTIPQSSAQCQFCHSTKMKIVKKGIQQLEQEIQRTFPDKRILRIDSTIDSNARSLEVQISLADIIVGTEKVLRTSALEQVDSIVVLSMDHLLTYPHYQSQERVFQLLTELQYAQKPLIIQTYAAHHPVWGFVKTMDVVGFLDAELRIRTMLKRPPVSPLWVARDPQGHESERFTDIQKLKQLPRDWLIDVIDD